MRSIIARILLLVLVFSQGASGQSSVQPRIERIEKEGGKVDSVRIRFNGETVEARRLAQVEVIPYEQLIAGKFAEAIEAYKKIRREKPDDNAVYMSGVANGESIITDTALGDAISDSDALNLG